MRISILGGGSWGTALAIHLAKNGQEVKIWEFFAEQANKMQNERFCPLLPEVKLPEHIYVTSSLEEALKDSEVILVVTPSDKVELTINNAAQYIDNQIIIIGSKGFASGTRLLTDALRPLVKGELYCLYGPTHAEEVCKGLFTGIVLAGPKNDALKAAFNSPTLKVETTEDLIGVQVAAALKNVLAIYVGVLHGMELGDNAKAFIMTDGLAEITKVGVAMGADPLTFLGLAGIGDIIVTCTSEHSRNRFVGEQVGKGRHLDEVLTEMKMIAEGVTTVKEAQGLIEKYNLHLPLITGLYSILFNNTDPREILANY